MLQQPFTVCDGKNVYLDHNATTPIASPITEKMAEWLKLWGNPSSIHWTGRGPKALLRQSRQNIANFIGAHPLEIVFTAGGSEANNLAIQGIRPPEGRNKYLFSAVEHPSVRKTMEGLKERGAEVCEIPVLRSGRFDMKAFTKLLDDQTALVSVMYANNETGCIYPIKELAQLTHEAGALFHCDGVQALGKTIVDVKDWGVDMASFSGHKFYGLKGCGILYVKSGTPLDSLIYGGGQERSRRAGTENLLAIASLSEMTNFKNDIEQMNEQIEQLRNHMEQRILNEINKVEVNGEGEKLSNTLCLIVDGVDGESLLMNLDVKGFSVSTGAACSSGNPEPSPVLLAMGLSRKEAQSSLRLSLGWTTTTEQVDSFVDTLKEVVTHLRNVAADYQEQDHV